MGVAYGLCCLLQGAVASGGGAGFQTCRLIASTLARFYTMSCCHAASSVHYCRKHPGWVLHDGVKTRRRWRKRFDNEETTRVLFHIWIKDPDHHCRLRAPKGSFASYTSGHL